MSRSGITRAETRTTSPTRSTPRSTTPPAKAPRRWPAPPQPETPRVTSGTVGDITQFEIGGIRPFDVATLGLAKLLAGLFADDLVGEHTFVISAQRVEDLADPTKFNASLKRSNDLDPGRPLQLAARPRRQATAAHRRPRLVQGATSPSAESRRPFRSRLNNRDPAGGARAPPRVAGRRYSQHPLLESRACPSWAPTRRALSMLDDRLSSVASLPHRCCFRRTLGAGCWYVNPGPSPAMMCLTALLLSGYLPAIGMRSSRT